jgi:uncharacterized protein
LWHGLLLALALFTFSIDWIIMFQTQASCQLSISKIKEETAVSDKSAPRLGTIGWIDLTVPQASAIRDFYAGVVGWKPAECSMGDYADYTMNDPETGQPIAGVCHARGKNVGLPPVWLIYITVADLDASVAHCRKLGGSVLREPHDMGAMGRYAAIRDPAGAVCALWQSA